jgi:hypothetical protein
MEGRYAYFLVIGLLLMALVAVLISGSREKDELRMEIYALSSSVKQKDAQIVWLSAELEKAKNFASALSNQNSALSSDNQKMLEEFNKLKSDAGVIKNELIDFEEKLKTSLEWFSLNSNLENIYELSPLSNDLKHSCVEIRDDYCRIKLSCLNFVNNEKNEFAYKFDNETKEGLQGLQEMYKNKGGDCEDYSLLAVAELNFLLEYCSKKEINNTLFYGYEKKGGKKHFVESSKEHYINDAEDYFFFLPNYYVVCGTFPKNRWESYGHCMLGFSDAPLENGVYESLSRALLVEPQTGEIKFDLRRNKTINIPENRPFEGDSIYLVFDSKDMYVFDSFNGKFRWLGYSELAERISSLKRRLGKLLV